MLSLKRATSKGVAKLCVVDKISQIQPHLGSEDSMRGIIEFLDGVWVGDDVGFGPTYIQVVLVNPVVFIINTEGAQSDPQIGSRAEPKQRTVA